MKDIFTISLDKKVKYIKRVCEDPKMYAVEVKLRHGAKGSVFVGYNEDGFDHVSFSPFSGKTPSWDEMCEIKDIFWRDEEVAVEVHPPKSQYVNIKDNCLHLWSNSNIATMFGGKNGEN